jgi:predicted nucleotidyltransferase
MPLQFILFGSYVKGTYKKHSDLDLLFLVQDKRFEKEKYQFINILS